MKKKVIYGWVDELCDIGQIIGTRERRSGYEFKWLVCRKKRDYIRTTYTTKTAKKIKITIEEE